MSELERHADETDTASSIEEAHRQASIAALRSKPFDPGAPGDCQSCGDHFTRIVRGHCGRCRDQLRLP